MNDTLDPSTGPSTEPASTEHDSAVNPTPPAVRYVKPEKATNTFNRIVGRLTRMGLSVWGSRELRVRGRSSGEWRTTPVNLLTHAGQTYLVAPRGTTQWVRNLRAAGGHGELRLGRNIETFVATELDDADKVEVLRAYLKRWKFEVGVWFEGVDASSADEELLAIAPGYPVFAVVIAAR